MIKRLSEKLGEKTHIGLGLWIALHSNTKKTVCDKAFDKELRKEKIDGAGVAPDSDGEETVGVISN